MVYDVGAIRKLLPLRQVPKPIAIDFDPLTGFEARNGIVPYPKSHPRTLIRVPSFGALSIGFHSGIFNVLSFLFDQFPSIGALSQFILTAASVMRFHHYPSSALPIFSVVDNPGVVRLGVRPFL